MSKDKIIKICNYIIEYGILAIVFLIPVIFNFTLANYSVFDLFKEAVFRIILSFILVVYIAKIFVQGKIILRGNGKIFLFILFLIVSFFISSLLSIHPNLSFWGSYERQQGFYSLVNYLLFFTLLILNLQNFKQIRRLIIVAVMAGAVVCFYGLIQFFGLDPFLWEETALSMGRIFSSLGQPNFFGHYLIITIPLSFYSYLFIAKKLLFRFFIGLVILAEFICLIATYSRSAWLGFIISAVFCFIFYLSIKKNKKFVISLGVLILIFFTLIFSLNFFKKNDLNSFTNTTFINRLKSITDLQGGSNKIRLYYWQASFKEIKQASHKRLLVGYGPDALDGVFIKYYQPDWAVYEVINTFPDRAHNWLFDVILSYGLIGLVAILWFYLYLFYKAGKFLSSQAAQSAEEIWLVAALSSCLVAYCVNNLFSFSQATTYVYLFLILAMLWFIVGSRKTEEIELKLIPVSKILIWIILLVTTCLFIYLENFNQVRADYYYMQAKNEAKKNNCRGALSNMERAINYNPASAYYKEKYIFYGLSCFSAVSTKDSQMALRDNVEAQIISIKPEEFQYASRLAVARAYSSFGFYINEVYYEKAEEIFNILIAENPYLLTSYQDFAMMKIWQKDYAGAIDLLKQAINFLPPLDHPQLNKEHKSEIQAQALILYERMGFSCSQLKNYNEALKYYKKALSLDPYRATSYKGLADIYYLQGQLDQAIVLNKRGLMLNPADYHWPLALSLLYREKKDLTKAKEYLDQALKLAPENQELKNYYKELKK